MLEQPEGIVRPVLGKLGTNVNVVLNDIQAAIGRFPRVQGGQQYFSPRLTQVFNNAQKQADNMKDEYISTEHLLLAIADEKDGDAGKILRQHGVKRDDLFKVIEQTRGGVRITDQNAEQNYQALAKYARDGAVRLLSVFAAVGGPSAGGSTAPVGGGGGCCGGGCGCHR